MKSVEKKNIYKIDGEKKKPFTKNKIKKILVHVQSSGH